MNGPKLSVTVGKESLLEADLAAAIVDGLAGNYPPRNISSHSLGRFGGRQESLIDSMAAPSSEQTFNFWRKLCRVRDPEREEQTGSAQIDTQAAEEKWLCPRLAGHV
jgi:hypothetical protein